jgi:ATP phosphoribosyltransferase
MTASISTSIVRLALPKGRMERAIFDLLSDAGVHIQVGSRAYRPSISLDGFDTKLLKPQNIVEMLHVGSRDIGFAGADWVQELGAEVVELLDTGFDPVRLVAAAAAELLDHGKLPNRPLLAATEYERLVHGWLRERRLDARVVRTFGATEVFPPEDADFIVDIAATGSTLAANGLVVFDELMTSSTRLIACPRSLEDAAKREAIERFVMLLRSVLEARLRVMLEVNVPADRLEAIIELLPCMREPTVARLHGDAGYAVKVAILRSQLPQVIPEVKRRGGTDIVVSRLAQIVP